MRSEMKFRFAMKKFLLTLLFIAGRIKCNFFSGVVGQKRPIKNVNKPERQDNTETGAY